MFFFYFITHDYSGDRAPQGLFSIVACWSALVDIKRAYMLALSSMVLLKKNTTNHCGVSNYTHKVNSLIENHVRGTCAGTAYAFLSTMSGQI
jgi:hypothetical protein